MNSNKHNHFLVLSVFIFMMGIANTSTAVQEEHQFGSSLNSYCYCGGSGGRSWDSTAINTFNVKYIEIRSELAEPTTCAYAGNHTVTIRINGVDVFTTPSQYINHTYYEYYIVDSSVNFNLTQGDTVTYYWTYTNTACIGGINYVTFYDSVPPSIDASPDSFGPVVSVNSSSNETFTVSNSGDGNLVIGTLSLSGTDASEFNLQNDYCSGQTLTTSGTCTFQVTALPTSEGSKSAEISIPSNDPDTPLEIPLSCLAYQSGLTIPYMEDFSAGQPTTGWLYYSSIQNGRMQVVDGKLRMDTSVDGVSNLNEAIIVLSLNGSQFVELSFFQSEFGDELTPLPVDSFSGHYNGDGVAICQKS